MSTQRILVTGANGQLGNEMRDIAASFPSFSFIFLSREELPVDDIDKVKTVFKNQSPAYCINCAAYTAVDKAESEKEIAFRINGEATGLLAAACKENNCRFIHISTDYVFDGMATSPYREDSPTHPAGVYGASKNEGEKLALQANADSIIIRTSWVYSQYGKNFVKTMIRLMNEKEMINVVNDQVGSPTYAADLAAAIMQIISLEKGWQPGIYHYSNKGITNWYEFTLVIKELVKSNCKINPIPTSQYPTPAKRPMYSVLDTKKIQEIFGIKMRDWKESLSNCLDRLRTKN